MLTYVAVRNVVAFEPDLLSDAYVLALTAPLAMTEPGVYYKAAKWMVLDRAGTYYVDINMQPLLAGYVWIDGVLVVQQEFPNTGDEIVRGEFTVTGPAVVRVDIMYRQGGFQVFSGGLRYRVVDDEDIVVEVSDATGMTGATTTVEADEIPDSELGPKPPIPIDPRFQLPLWPVDPNWRNDVAETLMWLTDVLQSETAAEQRRRLRSNPRRTVEATFSRWAAMNQFIYNMVGGVGQGSMLLPLWWDQTRLTQDVPAGTIIIPGDFHLKEFPVGSVAVIRGENPYAYTPVLVVGNNGDNLAVAAELTDPIPAGSTVTPVRVAQLWQGGSETALTSGVSEHRLRMNIVEFYAENADWGGIFYGETGKPVAIVEPNWAGGITLQTTRNSFTLDNEVGNVLFTDPTRQPRATMKCEYQIHTRAEMRVFRDLIHAMQGRYRTFHVPTFKDDFDLIRDISASEGALIVEPCGYTQFNNASRSIFRYIMIEKYDGTRFFNSIISSRVSNSEEWLYLAETFGNHQASDIRRICYAPVARLDIDNVEISRTTNLVAAVSLTYLLFDDRRLE